MEAAHPKPFLAAPSLSTGLFKITNSDVKQRVKTLKLYSHAPMVNIGNVLQHALLATPLNIFFAELSMMN
jgi:hypothetical protein